jgi:putative ABC transport system substrate-binding protein
MLLRLALLVLSAVALPAIAQPRLIAIANFGEHPALRAAVNGFKAEVVRQGLVEGKDVAFDDQHINFDRTLIPQLLPKAKRLGIPYNPGEDNDISNMKEMRAAAPKHGFEIAEVGIDSAADIPQRLQSLQGKVDAVFVIQSNILQTSLPVIAATTQRIGVPAINTLDTPVRQHQFLAAHALSYERMGANAGRIAARILKGEKPSAIAPHRPGADDYSIVISRKQAAQWKIEVPPALAKGLID